MISSLLIANRGEIAVRIIRTARALGLHTVAVHSEADADALHVALADEACEIGPAPARQSYLAAGRILDAARRSGVEAIHPGYGFLAENAEFAEACAAAGLVFVGPPAAAIRAMGLKDEAKAVMERAGVPVVPGYHGARQETDFLRQKAYEIGYPVLIKPVAGGGGKGMRRVDRVMEFDDALAGARREAAAAFGDPRVLVEKFVADPRHVEIQVFADAHGHAVHLFERDCSLQRRHQKVVEEAPAPGMTPALREAMGGAALAAARAVSYVGAGTVEFIVDGAKGLAEGRFHFMEMNTRLQVEHPVTEAITGIDLVEWQIRIASGEALPCRQEDLRIDGHAVEARLYAEDPGRAFIPCVGRLEALDLAQGEGIRVDSGMREGDEVTAHYDPMIAKVIAHAPTRQEALDRLREALLRSVVAGPKTNLALLAALLADPDFSAGRFDTGLVDRKLAALLPPMRRRPAAALGALRLLEREVERLAAASRAVGRGPHSPWATGDGFQLGPPRRLALPVLADGEPETVEIGWGPEGMSVQFAGEPLGVEGAEATLVDAETGVYVLSQGRQLFVRWPEAADASHDADLGAGSVRAPMHGKLLALLVAPGEAVERGRRLALVEAMKMEHALLAPFDGTVEDIRAEEGGQVAEGQVLMTIAPPPGRD